MSVINIENILSWWRRNILNFFRSYDPLAELSGHHFTELASCAEGFTMIRGNKFEGGKPLVKNGLPYQDLRAACASLVPKETIAVSISSNQCFVHRFDIPVTSVAKIQSTIQLELARVTPFSPSSILVGWHTHPEFPATRNLQVSAYVIRKDVVDPIFDAIGAVGAVGKAILVREQNGSAIPFALSPDGTEFGTASLNFWTKYVLASCVVLALSAAIASFEISNLQAARASQISEQTLNYEKDAIGVRKKLDTLNSKDAVRNAFENRKIEFSNRVRIFEELSKLLPTDTYLDSAEIEKGNIKIEGASPAPEKLIGILEDSRLFQNVSFAAPVFRNQGEEKSRFSIRLELEFPKVEPE